MKFFKIGLQITLLTIFIAIAVIGSGYLVYQSLSQIIDSIHKEARPDFKLILIKEIASDLNKVENSIRLYSLTGDNSFLDEYQQEYRDVRENLTALEDYVTPGSNEIQVIDSIRALSTVKLALWGQIRNLHRKKIDNPSTPLAELASKIDTTFIQPDTIKIEAPKKKSFFKRVFGKQDTTGKESERFFKRLFSKQDTIAIAPVIIDKSVEKEQIKQEIAQAEKQISSESQELASHEKVLYERNINVTKQIALLIVRLETDEQRRLETKTREADDMAAEIYRRLVIFTGASILLLIIVLVLFFRNLQKNKAYQNMLQRAKSEAENLAKAKERFVATVSHEMRTPVNAIFGLSEQMLQRVSDETLKTDLNIVHKSADHLVTLVNDTLDFSKIESQKMTFDQTDFLPVEIFNEVITLHQVSARSKGLQLELVCSIPANRVYLGDPVRLKQILINLFTNAIKFTAKGKITLEATEEKLAGPHYKLVVDVVDSGVGISRDQIDHIFEEFVQLDNDQTPKHRGTGLGLTIVKKLVDLQGGHISVKSLVGKGTRFTFDIPYPEGKIEKNTASRELEVPDWFRELNLLLVDDEDFNLYLLKNILNKWNISYSEAHNGLEAVELFKTSRFDLILMDMRMPVMNGYEASKQIIKLDNQAKIVALTATKHPDDDEHFREAGISQYMQKPFPERALFEILMGVEDTRTKPTPIKNKMANKNSDFDFEEVKNSLGGDEAFLNEMIELFIQSAEKCMEVLEQSKSIRDVEQVAEAAHKLAAPAKHMQANSLFEVLKQLERSASQTPDWDLLDQTIKSAQSEITLFILRLNQFLKREN